MDLEAIKQKLKDILDGKSENIEKSFVFFVNDIIEKGNRSHLVKKIVTDKNGKKKTVYVNPNKQYGLNKYSSQESKGFNIAVAKLKKAIDKCSTPEELLKLVLRNKDRFSDQNGKPLPIVREIQNLIDEKNNTLNNSDNTNNVENNENTKELTEEKIDEKIEQKVTEKIEEKLEGKVRNKITINSFPEKWRDIPSFQNLAEFMSENTPKNQDLTYIFENLGSLISDVSATIIKESSRGCYESGFKNVMTNEIKDKTNISAISTAIHEISHAIDFSSASNLNFPKTMSFSGIETALKKSVIKEIPEKTKKFLSQYEEYDESGKTKLTREVDALINSGNNIGQRVQQGELSPFDARAEIKRINSKIKKITNEHSEKIDKEIGHFEDFYDAMSGGKFRNEGKVTFGHGTAFKKVSVRAKECFANYCALSFSHPDLVENYIKKDFPELCESYDKLLASIATELKNGEVKKSYSLPKLYAVGKKFYLSNGG